MGMQPRWYVRANRVLDLALAAVGIVAVALLAVAFKQIIIGE